jgi:hypothetical protein
MLPRPDAPAKPLPYTTVDMSKLLAKKKADYAAKTQTQANQALRYGATNPPVEEDKKSGGGWWPSWGEIGNAAKIGGKSVIGAVNTIGATPIDIADEAVQGIERLVGVTPTDKFDPASVGSFNLFGEMNRGLQASTRRAVGDFTALPFIGKPSPSYTADQIRQKGFVEGLGGAILDYGNLAATAAPFVGPVAKGIQGIRGARVAGEIPYTYGVHVSPMSDLAEIQARQAMQQQVTALDAMPGSSYMWDARSPRTIGSIFDNAQMNPATRDYMMSPEELAAQSTPNIYITRAPSGQVFQDANIPGSSALRVAGNQEVLGQVPFDRAALQAALEKYGVTQRNATADALEAKFRGMNPQVRRDITNRTQQLAEQGLRNTISRATEPYYAKQYPSLNTLDTNAPLSELLKNPEAKKIYDLLVNK